MSQSAIERISFALVVMLRARHALMAGCCILVYEWIITFADEVRLIHKAPWSFIKAAFLLCRYCSLGLYPIIAWAYVGNHSQRVCAYLVHPVYALLIPLHILPQAVMLLRAYAFSGRQKWVLLILAPCLVAIVAIAFYAFLSIKPLPQIWWDNMRKTGCFPDCAQSNMKFKLALALIAAGCVDLVSLAIVIFFCVQMGDRLRREKWFILQGLLSFAAAAIVNSTAAALYFTNTTYTNAGTALTPALMNIIACRVILQLKASFVPSPTETNSAHNLKTMTIPTGTDGADEQSMQ